MQNQVQMGKVPESAIFLTTAPNEEVAADLGRGLVSSALAACVSIVPQIRSLYRWDNAVQDDRESQLVIKSRRALAADILMWLRTHHPYDEPEFIEIPIQGGSPSYLAWIGDMTAR